MKHKTNTYDLSGEYGIGYTSKGDEFWFDLEDYDKIKDYCWYLANTGYFKARSLKSDEFKTEKIYLHRVIVGAKDGDMVDHKRHKKGEVNYDNRKSNLRFANYSKNGMNQVTPKNNKSGCKGVFWNKRYNMWEAKIHVNNKNIYLGRFAILENAIKARRDAERKYYGEYDYILSQN